MRVSADTKAATREKILRTARRLFAENGYDATPTRDIARAAGIATGTLFNYFPTKEAIVACLAGEAVTEAVSEVLAALEAPGRATDTLEEDLFALIAISLRKLKPLRKHLPALLETTLSPLAASAAPEATSLRVAHLEAVSTLAARHGHGDLSPVALQLYWTLYTGVLAFWANDASPKQEDTLALIDDSLNMFVGWLREQTQADPTGREQ
jgi:AcrR family transcriptional regulator